MEHLGCNNYVMDKTSAGTDNIVHDKYLLGHKCKQNAYTHIPFYLLLLSVTSRFDPKANPPGAIHYSYCCTIRFLLCYLAVNCVLST